MESELEPSSEEAMLQEQEAMLGGSMATSAPESALQAPFAAVDAAPNADVSLSMEFEFDSKEFDINMDSLKKQMYADPESSGEEPETTNDLMGDLDLGGEDEGDDALDLGGDDALELGDEDATLKEILDILEEMNTEEVLEEELIVDMSMQKNGTIETNQATLQYENEKELARKESTQYKEENKELEEKINELKETITKFEKDNLKLNSVVKQLKTKLEESLLSNAKLIYSNRTLSDTSLNERQKNKIVEAIAQAKTPNEAKSLCETLKATVGPTTKKGPKSLSESVQRRSNLSGVLKRNKETNANDSFSNRMKKLAGIS